MIRGPDAEAQIAKLRERVDARLVPKFNGAIKYLPMLMDHPEWSDDNCIAFARKWHAIVIDRLRKKDPLWNDGIPYGRNIPTADMLKEAGR